MFKPILTAILVAGLAAPTYAKGRGYELYEDGSYSCTTDRGCSRAEKAQVKYYRKMGWECLTSFDWRGCIDYFN